MLPDSHLRECTFATATQETRTHIGGNHGRIPIRVRRTDQNHGRRTIPYIVNRQRPTVLRQHTPSSPLRISGQTPGRVGVASEPRRHLSSHGAHRMVHPNRRRPEKEHG